jgi:hypothetical protein
VAERINSRVLDTHCAGHAHIMNDDGGDVIQRANIDEDRRASPSFGSTPPTRLYSTYTRLASPSLVAHLHSVCRCCTGIVSLALP